MTAAHIALKPSKGIWGRSEGRPHLEVSVLSLLIILMSVTYVITYFTIGNTLYQKEAALALSKKIEKNISQYSTLYKMTDYRGHRTPERAREVLSRIEEDRERYDKFLYHGHILWFWPIVYSLRWIRGVLTSDRQPVLSDMEDNLIQEAKSLIGVDDRNRLSPEQIDDEATILYTYILQHTPDIKSLETAKDFIKSQTIPSGLGDEDALLILRAVERKLEESGLFDY